MPNEGFLIGIDVGTGSARAGVFSLSGELVASDKQEISLHREGSTTFEQSSEEIWAAVGHCVRGALAAARIEAESVVGIGFDATCSLVLVGEGGASLPVGDPEHPERNIIVWMDHRAVDQARRINSGKHAVLDYVGGTISPEMETPKLLWLKENRRAVYDEVRHFFDLTDFLTWKATGSATRSSCTVTCKWTYLPHENGWDERFFRQIDLAELVEEDFVRIGQEVVAPGTALGSGLSEAAASDLGLAAGTAVAAGLIDAHAGGIGTVGVIGAPSENLAYVFGTSSCTMTSTPEPVFVPGVWGPYHSAMVPGLWLNEGGQSAAGAAIDQLLALHPASQEADRAARQAGKSLPEWLADRAMEAGCTSDSDDHLSAVVHLAAGLHVVPEFIGNRAPYADPEARAVICGLGMSREIDSLVALYVAGLCGLGYGLRQIMETQEASGAAVKRIVISGGAGQSDLVRQLLADATGKPVLSVSCEEPVLLGSAILGAVAAGSFSDMQTAMTAMTSPGKTFTPSEGSMVTLHQARFDAFCRLQSVAREIRQR
ncbi:FGGY-family carbohydrate kinase [Granulosicoccus sp. 3-233]|uniref:FGGY-family carbohydrate kinase n=1 Tax=Granulosicoccus sp. 3-233 TaxID=3417969 RepID=UPI003D34C814